ncbi:DASH family cryptochrome [Halomonas nitroreducens]|uniref:Cryptochrome DASH n=1 Tax=Halomonas nitroreducens TaxID=447425 RepID=A0A3S0R1L5_9GAMM|nr:DASH family cryptochrome [Halomonas nitroreducens]RTR03815.1 DASH family cryptochrome [Halomonas nitroreducens]
MKTEIVWLRNDLRVADNPLFGGDPRPDQLLCVHVLDRRWLADRRIGPARLAFLWQCLIGLRGELLKRGSDLLVRVGEPETIVASLAEALDATRVRVRQEAGWEEARGVARLRRRLEAVCPVETQESGTLLDTPRLPMAIEAVPPSFSRFRRRVARAWRVPGARGAPVTLPPWPSGAPRGLPALHEVCPTAAAWRASPAGGFRFEGGEAPARVRLEHFLWGSGAVARYRQTRNGLVGADFSTRLSPWLAHGCLSARQVHDALCDWEDEHGANPSSEALRSELLWREYFHWAARQEGRALFGGREPPARDSRFEAWCRGATGVPFVDAGMRELAGTGWLSNRARQNVASYLIKDLGVDWRLGAAWFERCLIDYDVASNWGNWRYVAGVGRDTRERGFHILRQAEHYDPEGAYVARWQPALAELAPGMARHQPWRAAPGAFPAPLAVPDHWQEALLPRPDQGAWPHRPGGPS